jgi:hypothetical protein
MLDEDYGGEEFEEIVRDYGWVGEFGNYCFVGMEGGVQYLVVHYD